MQIFNFNLAQQLNKKSISPNNIPRYIMENHKTTVQEISFVENTYLSEKNEELFNAIKPKHNNLLIAPVGYGKTTFIINTCLCYKSSIIVAPTIVLKNQILADLQQHIEKENLQAKVEPNTHYVKMFINQQIIYVTTYQDLVNHIDFLHQVDLICIDECHWFFDYTFAGNLTDKLSYLLSSLTGRTTFVLISATPNAFEILPEETYVEHIIKCKIDKPKNEPKNIILHSSDTVISSAAIYENFLQDNSLSGSKGIIVSHKQTCGVVDFSWEELSNSNLGLGYKACNVAPSTVVKSLKQTIPNLDFISTATKQSSEVVNSILTNTTNITTNPSPPFFATSIFSVGLNLKNTDYSNLMVVSNSISYIRQALGRPRFQLENLHLLNIQPYTNPNYTTLSLTQLKAELNWHMQNDHKPYNPFVVLSNWWNLYEQHIYCNLEHNLNWLFPFSNVVQYKQNNLQTTSKNFNTINSFYGLGKLPKVSFKRVWHAFTSGNSEQSKIINLCGVLGINFGAVKLQAEARGHKKVVKVVQIENVPLTAVFLKTIIERNIQNGNIKIHFTE